MHNLFSIFIFSLNATAPMLIPMRVINIASPIPINEKKKTRKWYVEYVRVCCERASEWASEFAPLLDSVLHSFSCIFLMLMLLLLLLPMPLLLLVLLLSRLFSTYLFHPLWLFKFFCWLLHAHRLYLLCIYRVSKLPTHSAYMWIKKSSFTQGGTFGCLHVLALLLVILIVE